jgi:hypothetical protein
MKIIYDHTHGFGKMRHQAYVYMPIGAFVEDNEYETALESGWCPLQGSLWFQTRSTRINAKKYIPHKKILKQSKKIKFFFDIRLNDLKKQKFKEIYEKYIEYKKFSNFDLSLQDIINNSNGHLYYTHQNEIIGFCFFKILQNNMFAVEFAWDYKNPRLYLGKLNIHYLCTYAKMKGYKNLYLSSGYESCSIYKSDYEGFEWWTGMKWSNDTDYYRRLCMRDDNTKIDFDWENL